MGGFAERGFWGFRALRVEGLRDGCCTMLHYVALCCTQTRFRGTLHPFLQVLVIAWVCASPDLGCAEVLLLKSVGE